MSEIDTAYTDTARRARQYIHDERDAGFRNEIAELLKRAQRDNRLEDWEDLNDRFYTDLHFGTGGLRGQIGGGYNRMNSFVLQRATQGLANYLLAAGSKDREGRASVVIAHDSRRYSDHFALQAALVLAANGIRAWLFTGLRPTPELSFAVRTLHASAGIVVTASHNPPQYNGYKVYWNDGAQIVAPHDTAIIAEVGRVGDTIKRFSVPDADESGFLQWIDQVQDDGYVELLKNGCLRRELLREKGKELQIVYTPLHGTGAQFVERILGELGVQVHTVPEQRRPDGEFPTVKSPNPEEASALKMALELARRIKADLVAATDPDADRIGIAVPNKSGEFQLVTGNQLGALLIDYVLGTRSKQGTLPRRPAIVKTIVTSELQRAIALHWGAECYDTLTGFKNIASKIRAFEQEQDGPIYVIGGEESYGYMIGTEVRDKDGIAATLLTAEMCLYYRSQGTSLLGRLEELYEQFGYYEEKTISRIFGGQEGQQIMEQLMERLRHNPPREIAGRPVTTIRDVQRGVTIDMESGTETPGLDLPISNVLQFFLSDGSIVSARPSGTEPKIKFYASCPAPIGTPLARARTEIGAQVARIMEEIETWITPQ